MRYLLDTHALIWYSERNEKLPLKIEEVIDDPKNAIYVSMVASPAHALATLPHIVRNKVTWLLMGLFLLRR